MNHRTVAAMARQVRSSKRRLLVNSLANSAARIAEELCDNLTAAIYADRESEDCMIFITSSRARLAQLSDNFPSDLVGEYTRGADSGQVATDVRTHMRRKPLGGIKP